MVLTRREGRRCELSCVGYWSNIVSLGMFCDFVNFCLTYVGFASGQACVGFAAMLLYSAN
jgi:hypothetical protein